MAGVMEEDLRECRRRLAKSLCREDVDPTVWVCLLDLGLPFDAIREGYKSTDWGDLVATARSLATERREEFPTTNLPTGARARDAPAAAGAPTDEYTRDRAEAFSAAAGSLGNRRAEVRRFRDLYLGGIESRLSDDEAAAWLYEGRAPEGALEHLSEISRRLSKNFRWRIGDANWFVLTGWVPFVEPINVTVRYNDSRDGPSYLNKQYYLGDFSLPVETAEIVITAEPWVDYRFVSQAFKDTQRQLRRGDNRKTTTKILNAVRFVAQRLGTGKIRWPELQAQWNRDYPEWEHKGRNGLYEAFHGFLRPGYGDVKFPKYEPTPWQSAERAKRDEDRKRAQEVFRRHASKPE